MNPDEKQFVDELNRKLGNLFLGSTKRKQPPILKHYICNGVHVQSVSAVKAAERWARDEHGWQYTKAYALGGGWYRIKRLGSGDYSQIQVRRMTKADRVNATKGTGTR